MTDPLIAFSNLGIKFLLDSADDRIVTNFDDTTETNLDAGISRTQQVKNVKYQVPTGKELLILGAVDMFSTTGLMQLEQSDDEDASTNPVIVKIFNSGASVSPVNALMFKMPADKRLNRFSPSTANRTFTCRSLQGIEYTPT